MEKILVSGILIFSGFFLHAAPVPDFSSQEQGPLGSERPIRGVAVDSGGTVSSDPDAEEPTGTITLPQALAVALAGNPDLAAHRWELRALEAQALQEGRRSNPELEFELEEFGGTDELGGTGVMESTLKLAKTIETGGKRKKRAHAASLETKLGGWDWESKRLDVATEVSKAFADVLVGQERLSLASDLLELAEEMHKTVSQKVRAGKVSPIEETKARIELASASLERASRESELEAARSSLSMTWGSSTPKFDRASGQAGKLMPVPHPEEIEGNLRTNPDLARWVDELAYRKSLVDMEKAKMKPDLTFSGGIKKLNEAEDYAFVIGVSVPLPLFDRNRDSLRKAAYLLSKAGEERRAAEAKLKNLATDAYRRLVTANREAITLRDEVIPDAEAAFEATREGYRHGKFDYIEVLDAQRTMFEMRDRFLRVLADYYTTKRDLERLTAAPLNGACPLSNRAFEGDQQ